jgi:hypothetical protein
MERTVVIFIRVTSPCEEIHTPPRVEREGNFVAKKEGALLGKVSNLAKPLNQMRSHCLKFGPLFLLPQLKFNVPFLAEVRFFGKKWTFRCDDESNRG